MKPIMLSDVPLLIGTAARKAEERRARWGRFGRWLGLNWLRRSRRVRLGRCEVDVKMGGGGNK